MPRDQKCQVCGETTSHGHLNRHMKRHHPGFTLTARPESSSHAQDHATNILPAVFAPVQELVKASEVLRRCNFAPKDFPWSPQLLDKLPNLRLGTPTTPGRWHTPWTILPQAGKDPLVHMETIILGLNARLAQKKAFRGSAWIENESVDFVQQDWFRWQSDVLRDRVQRLRLLNVSLRDLHLSSIDEDAVISQVEGAVQEVYGEEATAGLKIRDTTFNLTPRGTWTDAHHDSLPHVSRGIGMSGQEDRPLKLWLVWPSTETRHLSKCYSNTTAALENLDHGSFFVQMPGETLVVPPNSAHAVFSLNSCVLYGNEFQLPAWPTDPCSMHLDVSVGIELKKACQSRITQLALGFSNSMWHNAFVDQFTETWFEDFKYWQTPSCSAKLLQVFVKYMNTKGSCMFCARNGHQSAGHESVEKHMRDHLGPQAQKRKR